MKLRPWHPAVVALLLVLAFCKTLPAREKHIGFVLEILGEWLVDGRQIEHAGEGLPAGATVTLSPKANFRSGDEWRVTIILLNNEARSCTCNSFESCKKCQPIQLPTSLTPSSSLGERLHQAVARLLSLDPERYVPAISREAGGPPPRLHDGVLLLDKGRIAIADWFRDIEPGSYALTFVYIGRDGESRTPAVLTLDWNAGAPPLPAPGLRPGLYVVRMFPARSAPTQALSQDAWILLASADQFESQAVAYREHVELTRHWENVAAVAVQTFLRACLDQLAAPVPAKATDK
jgi:hypothetical protein